MNDAAANEAPKIKQMTIEEKMEQWEGWDDSEWRPDWNSVYNKVVSWTIGGSILGAGHALTTGRAVVPNALIFAGYTTIVSGCYFVSREAFFGREIERFRQEALALKLPESRARDYPWRWDAACGGIAGALFGSLVGQNRRMTLVGAGVFGLTALALRLAGAASSDYVVPYLLPSEKEALEKARRRTILSDADATLIEDEEERRKKMASKPWIMTKMPEWSPIQAYSLEEKQKMEQDEKYDIWLEEEVQKARTNVGIKRELKALETERLMAQNPALAQSIDQSLPKSDSNTSIKQPQL